MQRFYHIVQCEKDGLPLAVVYRTPTEQLSDTPNPSMVFGPMSFAACQQFVNQVCTGSPEFSARLWAIGYAGAEVTA